MTPWETLRSSLASTSLFIILSPIALLISAYAQSDSGIEVGAAADGKYDASYDIATADVASPATIETENHVYGPGDEVKVNGSVWIEIVNKIDALEVVTIEVKDGQGNIVARENATVGTDGKYASTFSLLDSANTGTYTVQARVELDADALGLVKAITSATLQSSSEFVVAEPVEYNAVAEDREFKVYMASNSAINDFRLDQEDKKVSFFVEGNSGTTGVTEIRIPKAMLSGDLTVLVDQNVVMPDDVLLKSDTSTETVLEINYEHSIHRIEVAGTNVVPEFPVAIVMMAMTIGAMIAVSAFARRRRDSGLPSNP